MPNNHDELETRLLEQYLRQLGLVRAQSSGMNAANLRNGVKNARQ